MILTRWGTWIEAVLYYNDHLEDIKKVLEALDKNEAVSIAADFFMLTCVFNIYFIFKYFYNILCKFL